MGRKSVLAENMASNSGLLKRLAGLYLALLVISVQETVCKSVSCKDLIDYLRELAEHCASEELKQKLDPLGYLHPAKVSPSNHEGNVNNNVAQDPAVANSPAAPANSSNTNGNVNNEAAQVPAVANSPAAPMNSSNTNGDVNNEAAQVPAVANSPAAPANSSNTNGNVNNKAAQDPAVANSPAAPANSSNTNGNVNNEAAQVPAVANSPAAPTNSSNTNGDVNNKAAQDLAKDIRPVTPQNATSVNAMENPTNSTPTNDNNRRNITSDIQTQGVQSDPNTTADTRSINFTSVEPEANNSSSTPLDTTDDTQFSTQHDAIRPTTLIFSGRSNRGTNIAQAHSNIANGPNCSFIYNKGKCKQNMVKAKSRNVVIEGCGICDYGAALKNCVEAEGENIVGKFRAPYHDAQ